VSRALRQGLALLAVAVLLAGTTGCARKKIYGEGTPTIAASTGEDVIIELASNPTTGHSWMLSGQPDPLVAALMDTDYTANPSTALGAGGHQRWTFRAVGRGSTTIRFTYGRTWEPAPTDRSAAFAIVVR